MKEVRLNRLRETFEKNKIDALLITQLDNVKYISGFSGSTAVVVVTTDRAVILVDPRYTLQAAKEAEGLEIREYFGIAQTEAAAGLLDDLAPERVGFEADHLTVSQHQRLKKAVTKPIKLVPTTDIVSSLRLVKDADEIKRIKKAVKIADDCFTHILGYLKPGIRERDIAVEIDSFMRTNGAEAPSFETIVAAGPNAAFPHAKPGDAKIKAGQFVKMDYGAFYNLYASDITRTVAIRKATQKMKEIYNIVLEAQLASLAAIKPGLKGEDIDAVARNIITEKGYGENFGHGLGHSLGIAVHDGPGFSKMSGIILEPGMVMTVEPGIYIEGWGGVRIEDDIVVTEKGCDILTKSTKELLIL